MNPLATVVISVLAGAAAAVGVTLSLQPGTEAGPSPQLASLQSSLQALQDQNAELERRLAELGRRPATPSLTPVAREAAPMVTPEQVAAAVEAYLRKRGDGPADAALADADAVRAFDLEKDFEALVGSSYWDNPDAWKRAFEAGKMDEVLEQLEALAEADPNDVDAKMTLANAYLSYLQMDQSKWQLSMKADKQFDNVLDIDENHWGARFSKAVSYSFWPPLMGKQKEAISHFETLMQQQETLPVQDEHAQTYLYLGNMLAASDPDRAAEVWRKGLQRHPGSSELRAKLGQ